ncbi:hypothetical protein HYH02_015049 [Chlamydomonas schloesseri]|uniref:Uncharacterized protein n=1 Tax=Chlamydomonas schloesseri TaxID=2026947 RepID=A0A835SHY1_9CHLO|nr:hypothetical protein HYH02_015049 [Chlamydomonas schloesseri]|eukprot:KAG2425222.1 hypothetical protein HYH02_015049 [Chlamydomonas schloesseri]
MWAAPTTTTPHARRGARSTAQLSGPAPAASAAYRHPGKGLLSLRQLGLICGLRAQAAALKCAAAAASAPGAGGISSVSSRCLSRRLRCPCPTTDTTAPGHTRRSRTVVGTSTVRGAARSQEPAAAAPAAAGAAAVGAGLQPAPAAAAAGGVTRVAVGIDLGTTTSAVAVVGQDGRPRVVEDQLGRAVIPSVVYVQPDGEVLVGQAAVAAAAGPGAQPANAYFGVKRLMGRSYREALQEVEEDEAQAAAAAAAAAAAVGPGTDGGGAGGSGARRLRCYELVEGPGGRVEVACPALGRSMTPQEVSAHLIRHLVGRAQAFLARQQQQQQQQQQQAEGQGQGQDQEAAEASSSVQVLDAVITVPARYGPAQRAAVMEAARAAGLQRVSLLQEPIAAAIAYGFGSAAVPYDVLLVFDLGGGTTDLTVVEAFDGIMEVIGTAGDNYLGGDDFTAAVADWLGAKAAIAPGQGAAVAGAAGPDPAASLELLRAAEAAKLALSEAVAAVRYGASSSGSSSSGSGVSVRVRVPAHEGGVGGVTADCKEVKLSEQTFEQLVRPLMRRMWWPLERLAVATRLQLGGSLPPELDPRLQPPLTSSASADEGADASATQNGAELWKSMSHGSNSSGVGGYSLASGTSAWDLGLGEGPGRRDGAAAWEFSIFPQQREQQGAGSGASSSSGSKFVAPPRRLSGLVLVGAATRLPVVRQYVMQVSGLPIRSGVDPETAVALGAALHAGLMTGRVAGGVEMNDGGYVAAQHGRASGFQEAVAAQPPQPPPQPSAATKAGASPAATGGRPRQPKQRRSASGRTIKTAVVLTPRTPRAAPDSGLGSSSSASSDEEGPLVWEP